MKICLRRVAHISTERRISVQTDMKTDIEMETNIDMDMGVKHVYRDLRLSIQVNQ